MFHDGKSSYIILSVFCIPLLSFPPHFRMTIVLQFLCIWKWRQKWTHLPQLARKNLGDHPQLARNQKNDRRNLGAGGLQRACRRTGETCWLRMTSGRFSLGKRWKYGDSELQTCWLESDDVWQIFKCDRRSQHFNAFHLCEDVFGENSEDLAEEIEDEMPPS